jgi:hypothetical protein
MNDNENILDIDKDLRYTQRLRFLQDCNLSLATESHNKSLMIENLQKSNEIKDEVIQAYSKSVNEIDDFLEYQVMSATPVDTQAKVYNILLGLTDTLKKIYEV